MKYLLFLGLFFQLSIASAFAQQYKYHTVQKGETLSSIAREYNISVETLYTYNPDARSGINVNSKFFIFCFYSHSMVAGGFELMSYTTLLTPFTLLIIVLDVF